MSAFLQHVVLGTRRKIISLMARVIADTNFLEKSGESSEEISFDVRLADHELWQRALRFCDIMPEYFFTREKRVVRGSFHKFSAWERTK